MGVVARWTLGVALNCLTTAARAEVCDKYSILWLPSDGPLVFFGFSYLGATAVAAGVLGLAALGWHRVAIVAACALVLVSGLGVVDGYAGDEIIRSALIEGCRSTVADWYGFLLSATALAGSATLVAMRRRPDDDESR